MPNQASGAGPSAARRRRSPRGRRRWRAGSSSWSASAEVVIRSAHMPAPPGPIVGGGEAPGRGRRGRPRRTRLRGPSQQPRPACGSPPLARASPAVEVEPPVEQRVGGIPGHRRVVAVAGGHHPAGPARPPHLPKRRHRVGADAGGPGGRGRRRSRRRRSEGDRRRPPRNSTPATPASARASLEDLRGTSIPTTRSRAPPGRPSRGDRARGRTRRRAGDPRGSRSSR